MFSHRLFLVLILLSVLITSANAIQTSVENNNKGYWTYDFYTVGTNTLKINSVNTFGKDLLYPKILCNGIPVSYEKKGNDLIVNNYSCNGVGTFRTQINKIGNVSQSIQFGTEAANLNSYGFMKQDFVEYIDHSDQCLIDCYLDLKIKNPSNSPLKIFDVLQDIDFVKKNKLSNDLSDWGIQKKVITVTQEITSYEHSFIYNTGIKYDGNVGKEVEYVYKALKETSPIYTDVTHEEWVDVTINDVLERDESIDIRIWGKKIPKTGENDIDVVPTVSGYYASEWSWWNSNYQYRQILNVYNTSGVLDLNMNSPIDLNYNSLTSGQYLATGCDLKITNFAGTSQLDVNVDTERTRAWFLLDETIPALNDLNYYLYYGNAAATCDVYADKKTPPMQDNYTIGLYRFNNSSVNKVDSNNGVLFGGAAYSSTEVFSDYSLNLTGDNEGMQFGKVSHLSDVKSFSWFFKPAETYTQASGKYPFFIVAENDVGNQYWYVNLRCDGAELCKFRVRVLDGSPVRNCYGTTTTWTNGQIYHANIDLNGDGTGLSIYIDGVLENTCYSSAGWAVPAAAENLGKASMGYPASSFNGLIDEYTEKNEAQGAFPYLVHLPTLTLLGETTEPNILDMNINPVTSYSNSTIYSIIDGNGGNGVITVDYNTYINGILSDQNTDATECGSSPFTCPNLYLTGNYCAASIIDFNAVITDEDGITDSDSNTITITNTVPTVTDLTPATGTYGSPSYTDIIPVVCTASDIDFACGQTATYYLGGYYDNGSGSQDWHLLTSNATGIYDWNVFDLNYQTGVDLNCWVIDSNLGTSTVYNPAGDITIDHNMAVVAQFSYYPVPPTALDTESGILTSSVDLNDESDVFGLPISAWSWDVNSVNISIDQNTVNDFTVAGDYNVCLTVTAGLLTDINCQIITIREYPQNLDFSYSPDPPSVDEVIDFNSSSDSILDFWEWDVNGVSISTDENTTYTFTNTGDYNVCVLGSIDGDLNKQYCETIHVYGKISINFYDEETHLSLSPTATWNGGAVVVDGAGHWETGLFGYNGRYILSAYTATHSIRYWTFDVNEFSDIDLNVVLLLTGNGRDINFQFYDPDLALLSNAKVTLNRLDTNRIASIRYLDADAKQNFFMNVGDINYSFRIETDTNTYTYYAVTVTVHPPFDEDTNVLIDANYNLTLDGLSNDSFTDIPKTDDQNFYIYANVLDYWFVIVESDDNTYYNRTYAIQVFGDVNVYELQPYLVNTDVGFLSTFYVLNNQNRISLVDVLVIGKKYFGDTLTLIESKLTDASGIASFSLISQDTYYFDFYYLGELIEGNMRLVASSTSYYVLLDIAETIGNVIGSNIDINFYPSEGSLLPGSPQVHLLQVITPKGNPITKIDINITNGTTNVYSQAYTSGIAYGGTFNQDINISDLDIVKPLIVTLLIETAYDTVIQSQTYYLRTSDELLVGGVFDFRTPLQELKEEVLGDVGAILLSVFIAMMACVGAASQGMTDKSGLFVLALIVLGVFTYLTWIPLLIWGLAAVGGVSAYILTKGV